MNKPLLHIFRNTPFGRETLLLSAYSCRRWQLSLDIYLPRDRKFLFYFNTDVVQVDLDGSYLSNPESAELHAKQLLEAPQRYRFIPPKSYTATGLPDLPGSFSMMTCPRSMSDVTSRIGLGHIGPKVRRVLQVAPFPVLIPNAVYKPWTKLVVLYGGSPLSAAALRLALKLQQRCQTPLQVISAGDRQRLEQALAEQGLSETIRQLDWQVFPGNSIARHLYEIQHDALVVLGAYGHGPIKAIFGSTMESVQSQLPNPLLVVGPKYAG